ncbi:MAG: peptidase domain-containing ABC transporter [Lacunisphaera sp.]|nr:peptidase domain-containing ABC transporter [Lacunisphaera sp.]
MRVFKQRDITDCGAACLGFVAAHYRKVFPVARLRQLAGTSQQGSTALGMVEAARQLGFTAKGVKGGADALPTVPLPAIAHCLIDRRLLHYVVLIEWTPKYARVMDPALGRVDQWSHEKFKSVWTGVLILLAPGDSFQPGDHTVPPWQRLWNLLQPHKAVLAQAFVGAVVTTVLGLAMAVYVQKIVDRVIPDGNRQLLNLLGVSMLAILGCKLVLGWFQSLLSIRTAQRIDTTIMLAYYRHLLRLPQAFFDTMRVGEITSRVGDAVKIRHFLNSSLLSLLLNPLILLFSLGAMFFWSWKLALLSLALLPLNALIYWFVDRANKRYQRQLMERGADFSAQLVESLNAQPVIRRFQLEADAALRTETRLVRLMKTIWRSSLMGLGSGTATTLVTQVYLIGLLWLGAGLVLEAGLTPGQLMSCYTLAGYLTGPLAALIGLNTSIQETLIATDRLFELMDLELEKDQGLVEFTPRHARDIRLEGVTFKHAGRMATLQDITLTLPAGRITALVGESGCGKSTLLALLQRLYLPATGRILIGDVDLQYFQLASLRRHLAVMPQQTHLLSGTVLENLAPGDYQPDMERLLQVCREVGVLEFIEQLPQGFFTHLNENGANLSGGQRQRLALARALNFDAPVLLLDEPSSALDAKSEETLLALLQRLRDAGRTIIVAAHTPRLLAVADKVVTMSGGRIIADEVPVQAWPAESDGEQSGKARPLQPLPAVA